MVMTVEEKVELAQKVFQRLQKHVQGRGSSKFSSEWSKWSMYASRRGFARALAMAKVLRDSPSLRDEPQRHYRVIAQVAEALRKELEPLAPSDLADVLGYVRWMLVAEKL
jgi:MoxR-like ATPase